MIIGKNSLILLIGAIIIIAVVEGIAAFFRNALGVNIGMELACLISFFLIIAITIPWLIFAEKYKKLKEIKHLQTNHGKRFCSHCGKVLNDTKFGMFCETCQRYE